jgi:tryptophanyl-tRNA synthetase
MLRATEDETAKLVKQAKTDAERRITYDPEARPGVANLLLLVSLCGAESPTQVAERIGDGGAFALKREVVEALNETLRPIRQRREQLASDAQAIVAKVLSRGAAAANAVAEQTLRATLRAMEMDYGV